MPTQTFAIFTPTIWSPRINYWLRKRLVATRVFADYSDEVANGGDTINIPSIADGFSATAITVTTGSVTGANISDTKSALSINTWVGNALVITDFQKAQVMKSYRLQEEYMQAQAYALAKTLDYAVIRLAASTTITTVGNSSTALLATTIEKAMSILASRSVPLNECTFLMHPKTYIVMGLILVTVLKNKFLKLQGTLKNKIETICSQIALIARGSETIIGTPAFAG